MIEQQNRRAAESQMRTKRFRGALVLPLCFGSSLLLVPPEHCRYPKESNMTPKQNTVALCLMIGSLCSSSWAQSKQPNSTAVVYDVKMSTSMTIPVNRKIEQVRVWHALPTPRPWFGPVERVSWYPDFGERQYNEQHDSHHVFFRKNSGLTGNERITFQTQFQVVSQDRDFDPRNSKTKWRDIGGNVKLSGNSQVQTLAKESRSAPTPAEAVLSATQHINKLMKYDANVAYSSVDLEQTLANKKGHCGHYFTLLKSTCEELGIKTRVVYGLNLYCADGVSSDLHKVRADYTNIHTWAEIYLPEDGWVEIEPTESTTPFTLKAHLIQNNPWFQNCAVWIREDGKDVLHQWRHVGGRYTSDFALSNTITYTVQPLEKLKRSK